MRQFLMILSLVAGLLTPMTAYAAEPNTGYTFLGDSRTVGMDSAVSLSDMDDVFVVAECGMGYDWMIETGLPEVQDIMKDHPEYEEWKLITNLGINDVCCSAGNYMEAYEELLDDITIYVVSVNPCKGTYKDLNRYVVAFNKELKDSGFTYIDTWSVLNEEGFDSRDGLHYDKETYKLIFNIIAEETGCGKDYEGKTK